MMSSLCATGNYLKQARTCDDDKKYGTVLAKCTTDYCNHAPFTTPRSLAIVLAAMTSLVIY